MKKIVAFLLAFTLVVVMGACSNNNSSTSNGSTNSSTTDSTTDTTTDDSVYMAYMNEHYEDVTDSLEEVREMLIEDVNDFDYKTELKEERQELETTYKYFNDYKDVPTDKQEAHKEYVEALNMGIEAIDLAEAGDVEAALTKVNEAITLNNETIVKYGITVDND